MRYFKKIIRRWRLFLSYKPVLCGYNQIVDERFNRDYLIEIKHNNNFLFRIYFYKREKLIDIIYTILLKCFGIDIILFDYEKDGCFYKILDINEFYTFYKYGEHYNCKLFFDKKDMSKIVKILKYNPLLLKFIYSR